MASDEELMLSWQRGGSAALDALVGRFHTPVYRYLLRLTARPELAEDLTQDCFVRLVGCAALYKYPRPVRPWVDHDDLQAALCQLSADHREVIILCYTEDFSLAEISTILHVPLGTVKTRLLRALRRLRTLLEERRAEEQMEVAHVR